MAEQNIDTLFGPPAEDDPVNQLFGDPVQVQPPLLIDDQVAGIRQRVQEAEAETFLEAIEAGWQLSVAGLVERGRNPEIVVPEDAGMLMHVVAGVSTLAGDVPAMLAGAAAAAPAAGVAGSAGAGAGALAGPFAPVVSPILGGVAAAVPVAAGASAAPEWLRAGLMDFYDRGGTAQRDYVASLMKSMVSGDALIAGGKGALVGGASLGAGKLAGPVLRPLGARVAKVGALSAEVGTAVTTASALEGKLPAAEDFANAALLVGALHGTGKVGAAAAKRTARATKQTAAWLRSNYAKTGEHPLDAAKRLQKDKVARQKLYTDVEAADKAEGYTFDAYHGTTANIYEFDVARAGTNTGAAEKAGALFFAKDPALASRYAQEPGTSGANVMPVRLKMQNPMVVDGEGKLFGGGSSMDFYLRQAKANGFDSVVFKNIRDNIGDGPNNPTTVYAVFDQKQIRGKFGGLDETYGQAVDRVRAMANPGRIASDVAEDVLRAEAQARRAAFEKKSPVSDEQSAQIQSEVEAMARGEKPITPEDRVRAMASPGRIASEVAAEVSDVEAAAQRELFQRQRGASQTPEKDAQINADVQAMQAMLAAAGGGGLRPPSAAAAAASAAGGDGGGALAKILRKIRSPEKVQYTVDDFMFDFYNDLQWASVAVRNALDVTIGKKARRKLSPAENPAEQLRLAFGAFARAELSINEGLKPIIKDIVRTKEWDEFVAYSVARRAVELEGRGIKTGFDLDAASELVASGSRFADRFQKVVDYQNSMLDEAVQAGIVSAEKRDLYKELNENYVPFSRVMDDAIDPSKVGSRGFSVRNPTKRIKGSTEDVINPFESIVKNTYVWKQVIENNKALTRLLDFNNTLPEDVRFLTKSKKQVTATKLAETDKEFAQFLNDHGIDPSEADGIMIYRAANKSLSDTEVLIFENGKPVVYNGDANLIKSLRSLDSGTHNVLVKLLQIPAAAFRAGTTLTPEFMARNFVRDQLGAVMQNTFTTIPGLDFGIGAWALWTNKDAVRKWVDSGGANSAMLAIDKDIFKADYFALEQNGVLPTKRMWNTVATPFRMLQVAGMTVENATRLGQFLRAKKEGVPDVVAAMRSRDVSLDFYRMGARIRALNAMGTFLGPQINGLGRAVEAFDRDPRGTAMKGLATITLPTLYLWWANHDQEWYRDGIQQWEKDAFWHIGLDLPGTDGVTIIRIPKPPVFGTIFGSIPQRFLESYVKDNPHAWHDIGQTLMNEFNPAPSAIPVAVSPLYEIGANWNFFTDTPLVPRHVEQTYLPEYQHTEYTSATAKAIAKAIPEFLPDRYRTPIAVDHLVKTWTGGLGKYVVELADQGLYAAGVTERPVRPTRTLADVPFIRAFITRHPSGATEPLNLFYERTDKIDKTLSTFTSLMKAGRTDEANDVLHEAGAQIASLSRIREAIGDMRGVIRLVNENPEVSPDEKRQIIDDLYMQMNTLAKHGNMLLDEIDRGELASVVTAPAEMPEGTDQMFGGPASVEDFVQ